MIFLKLFLTFFEIGLFTFGGGYAMIPLIREKALANNWFTEDEIMNFIAISESTPGPIAINMATFTGSAQGGILGAMCATLGVVLPSFVIILVIAALIRNFIKYKGVRATLDGIRPVISALILGTAVTMALGVLFNVQTLESSPSFNLYGIIIFAVAVGIDLVYKKILKKTASPILLLVISGVLGAFFF